MQVFGKNVKIEIQNNELIIKVDLNESTEPSKSGKSLIVATTHGNAVIKHGDVELNLGLNLYLRQPKKS